jgi:hypothetical protein
MCESEATSIDACRDFFQGVAGFRFNRACIEEKQDRVIIDIFSWGVLPAFIFPAIEYFVTYNYI